MSTLGSFIWSIADQLRGPYRPNQYGNVILPLAILRRLDCILEPDRDTVRELAAKYDNLNWLKVEVKKATGRPFYNTSNYSFANLLEDADGLADNLADYIDRFSPDVDVFEYFDFKKEILALEKAELLREIVTSFKAVDLHPDVVSNADMGDAFEYIIRRFNEAANETSGDHYTPRNAIRLLVDLLFAEKDVDLTAAGIVRTLYDPTAGTGGMLPLAEEHLLAQNPDAKLSLYGQEYTGQSYAIRNSDLLAKGHDATNIAFGNTITDDAFKDRKFDFCMSNPPYGVDWKQYAKAVKKERDEAFQRRPGHQPGHHGACGRILRGSDRSTDGRLSVRFRDGRSGVRRTAYSSTEALVDSELRKLSGRLGTRSTTQPNRFYTSTSSAILTAMSAIESSAVFKPVREASNGLSSRRASYVVSCTTGMSCSRARSSDSSLSAIPSPAMRVRNAGVTNTIPTRDFARPLSIARSSGVPSLTSFSLNHTETLLASSSSCSSLAALRRSSQA